jgi:rod shape-determining protein MreC
VVVNRSPKKKRFLVGLLGIVIGFFIGYCGAPLFFSNLASYVAYPILLVQQRYIDPLKQIFVHKRERLELEAILAQLRTERDDLNARLTQIQAITCYTDDIQELVAFKKRYECLKAVVAQVLVKHISPQSHYFLIDAGSLQGVHKDMVAVYKNMLLGKVTEVYPQYSKVVIITDSTCKVASCCAQTKAVGIHVGSNEVSATQMHHVSHLATLQEQDLVLSSGEGLVFPRGFALGRVKQFQVDGLLYQVTVEPLCDISCIQYCYVLQKGDEFALQEDHAQIDNSAATDDQLQTNPDNSSMPSPGYRGIDRARGKQR